MDDVTDMVFREIVNDCAPPDLFFTEFVNVDGLQSPGRPKLLPKLRHSTKDVPIIAQIWGKTPDNYYKTTKDLLEMGFAGVDINMGCPERRVVANGCCVALINNRALAKEIIEATQSAANNKLPVSVKTRLGFNEIDLSWHEFLLEQELDALTIHGRTKRELSEVPAHWDSIGDVRKLRDKINPKTKIIGNGDVANKPAGQKLATKYKLDGIMIGRGVLADPFAFSSNSSWPDYDAGKRKALYAKHITNFASTWANNERNIHSLKKFSKLYINNFNGAKELREKLMLANSADELVSLLT